MLWKLWEEVIGIVFLEILGVGVDGWILLPVSWVAGVEEGGAFLEEDRVVVGCIESLDVVIFFG